MKRFASFLAVMVLAFLAGCTQIETGNVGVSKTRGKIDLVERPQGNYFTPIESLSEFTTKEWPLTLDNQKPKSSDNLTIADLDVDIYIQAVPDRVAETVAKYQGDVVKYSDLVKGANSDDLVAGYGKVSREAREAIYVAVAQFPATTMHAKRTELAAAIAKQVQSELDRTDPKTWVVTGANVRNLVTDPAIEQSIRAAAQKDLEIAAAEKDKTLATKKGEALLETAKAEANANREISASLTPQLVRLKEIEAQRAFAGAGTHTVVMGSAGGALVNIGK